jgi:sugar lactone lactonase YvrE
MHAARRTAAGLAALGAAVAISACDGGTSLPRTGGTPTPAASATTAASPTPAISVAPTPTPSPTIPLATCPAKAARAADLAVIWRGGQPDDLAVGQDGALWISDASTQVTRVVGGKVVRTLRGLSEPEGMVPLLSGDIVVAEQGRDRVLVVRPDDSRAVVVQLPAAGAQLGVDGIALDAQAQRIVVPDSPHGTLLSVPLSALGTKTTLATGLGRPVGAAVDRDGTIWLAAENESPRGLLRVDRGGKVTAVGKLAQLDDIVLLGGVIYVTDLRNRSVHAVDPATGTDRTLATGFAQPQGLTAMPDGSLAVADPSRGVVQRLPAC